MPKAVSGYFCFLLKSAVLEVASGRDDGCCKLSQPHEGSLREPLLILKTPGSQERRKGLRKGPQAGGIYPSLFKL